MSSMMRISDVEVNDTSIVIQDVDIYLSIIRGSIALPRVSIKSFISSKNDAELRGGL